MDFDGTGNSDEIGFEIDEDFAKPGLQRLRIFVEVPIAEAEKIDRNGTEDREGALRFVFADLCVSRFCSIRHDHRPHRPSVAKVKGEEPSATDDFIVGMWRQHEQTLAA